MGPFEERFPWVLPVLAVIFFANALLWALEALSLNQNAYVSALFIIFNLLGMWVVLSLWRKRRRKSESGS